MKKSSSRLAVLLLMGSAGYSTATPANGVLFINNRTQLFAVAVK